jgi:hypothetical protein
LINSNPNAVSFEVVNNTLGSSSQCTPGVGLTVNQKILGLFDPTNQYTVNGWTSATDCSGTKISSPAFTPGTATSCIFTFTPTSALQSCTP